MSFFSMHRSLNLKNAYFIFFVTLFLWSLLAFLTLIKTIDTQKSYAKLINISGKQRMLLQQTSLFSYQIWHEQDSSLKLELLSLRLQMSKSHQLLLKNLNSDDLKTLYLDSPTHLDPQTRHYLRLLKNFSDEPSAELLDEIIFQSKELLPKLDSAVKTFEMDSNRAIQQIKNIETWIFAATVLTLLIEMLLIFLPAIRRTKQAEKQLIQEKEHFSQLFHSTKDGILICNQQGLIIETNQSLCKLFQTTHEHIVNTHLTDWFVVENIHHLIRHLLNWQTPSIPKTLTLKTADSLALETQIEAHKILLNEQEHLFISVSNLSAIHSFKKKLDLALDKNQIAYWELNTSNNNLRLSEMGYAILDLEEKPSSQNVLMDSDTSEEGINISQWKNGIHRADRLKFESEITQLTQGEQSQLDIELRYRQSNEIPYNWLHIKAVSLQKNTLGETVVIAGIFTDISKQKNLMQALTVAKQDAQKANSVKSEFLANMSHEIRTPLNGVIGLTELALDTPLDSTQQNYLENSLLASKSLLHIINDILDYSKIEAGKLTIEKEKFSIRQIIKNVANLYHKQIHSKGLQLKIDISPETPDYLMGDAHRITQILNNLVSNSLKFTEEGFITLRISVEKNLKALSRKSTVKNPIIWLAIDVEDTGIGIAENLQKKLFQPFEQGDSSTAKTYGGTGLGLVICRKLIKLMEGQIEFESKPQKGTRFSLTLPLEETTQTRQHKEQTDKSTPVAKTITVLNHPKLLLVEDNEINQLVAQTLLSQLGFDVSIASNGEEAVHTCQNTEFELVLMDIQMPIMDGHEAAKQILENKPELPIVALSASVTEAERQKTLDSGMKNHLSKPIERDALIQVLSEWFEFCETPN